MLAVLITKAERLFTLDGSNTAHFVRAIFCCGSTHPSHGIERFFRPMRVLSVFKALVMHARVGHFVVQLKKAEMGQAQPSAAEMEAQQQMQLLAMQHALGQQMVSQRWVFFCVRVFGCCGVIIFRQSVLNVSSCISVLFFSTLAHAS